MNKKLLCIILILMALAVNSMALDFMGPPTAGLQEGQGKIGYTYHQSENDWLGKSSDLGIKDVPIDGIDITRHYATFNYGLSTDRIEVYGFIGASDVECDNLGLNGGSDIALGGGIKITTNHYDNWDWGILGQASWFRSDDSVDVEEDILSADVDLEVEVFEIQVATGPTFKINKDWKIYGGGFGYWVSGDIDIKGSGTFDGEPFAGKVSGDLEQDSAFGGYIGTQISLGEHAALAIEFAATGDSQGIGANIRWGF